MQIELHENPPEDKRNHRQWNDFRRHPKKQSSQLTRHRRIDEETMTMEQRQNRSYKTFNDNELTPKDSKPYDAD